MLVTDGASRLESVPISPSIRTRMSSPLLDAMQWRHATKGFDAAKKVPAHDLDELLEVLRLSPSSYGIQPWKFIVVSDQILKDKLQVAAYNQAQVGQSSHLIVLCAKESLDEPYILSIISDVAKTRGIPENTLNSYRDMMLGSAKRQTQEQLAIWNQKQVYIALGTLLTACALKQIDACPMEGFDAKEFDEILGLKEKGLHATVICPIGYRGDGDYLTTMKKVRFPKDQIIEMR